jgi:hypothetical protein
MNGFTTPAFSHKMLREKVQTAEATETGDKIIYSIFVLSELVEWLNAKNAIPSLSSVPTFRGCYYL